MAERMADRTTDRATTLRTQFHAVPRWVDILDSDGVHHAEMRWDVERDAPRRRTGFLRD